MVYEDKKFIVKFSLCVVLLNPEIIFKIKNCFSGWVSALDPYRLALAMPLSATESWQMAMPLNWFVVALGIRQYRRSSNLAMAK